MKSAREWADLIGADAERLEAMSDSEVEADAMKFVVAIQRDALESAAQLCESKSCGVRVTLENDCRDDGFKDAAEQCAEAIRKLMPPEGL